VKGEGVKGEEIGWDCNPTQFNRPFKETYFLNPIGEKGRKKKFMRVFNYFFLSPFFLFPFPLFMKKVSLIYAPKSCEMQVTPADWTLVS
jgi:hypothetical protein